MVPDTFFAHSTRGARNKVRAICSLTAAGLICGFHARAKEPLDILLNPFSASQLSTTNFSLYNTYKI